MISFPLCQFFCEMNCDNGYAAALELSWYCSHCIVFVLLMLSVEIIMARSTQSVKGLCGVATD